jgi:hypothetical protein
MDVAPAALENLSHAYNPDTGTLDTRDNSAAFLSPEVLVCQVLASAGKLQLGGVNIGDPTALLGLPPTDAICARLLSGDANNDGKPDDLNGNGIPDLTELRNAMSGGAGGTSTGGGSASLPGLPPVTAGSSR